MSISFSGLASGLDTSSWVEALVKVKKQAVTTLEAKMSNVEVKKSDLGIVQSSFVSLRTSLEKLTDAKFGSSFDLFQKYKVSSSDEKSVSASVTSSATTQNLEVIVNKLATATVAKSADNDGVFVNASTKFIDLASSQAKAGDFSIYVNGEKNIISVDEEDTVGDILIKIADETGLQATVENGKVCIASPDGEFQNISIGSTSDSSNFASVMSLVKQDDGSYQSFNAVSKVNTTAKLTSDKAGFSEQIQTGSFKIGDATFTITENTTLNSLINDINRNADAHANAYWDASAGKMVLTSTVEGNFNINIENLSGNFTDVLGFTESTFDTNGAVISSKLKDGTQTLGNYAELSINGTKLISSSNTVTSDISGLTGVTLNLHAVSEPDAEPTKLEIKKDNSQLVDAVKSFVKDFNNAMEKVNTATASDATLYGEFSLTSIKNNLRSAIVAPSYGGSSEFRLLSQIGISNGAASAGFDINKVDTFSLDEEALIAALDKDPAAVKELLVGKNGIMTRLENIVDAATDASKGYFASRSKNFSTEISNYQKSITKEETNISDYKKRLEAQFASMEKMIASLQSQYSNVATKLG